MAATIKDIAQKTGLGYATISAYLNGNNVRPQNRAAIEHAIKELGYVRNDYARGLKTHKSMTIGVLIPELSNSFSTTIISEMEDILRVRGYGIIVCDCRSNINIEKESLNFLMSKMVDGLIVMPILADGKFLEPAIERKVPIVVIDRMTEKTEISYIVINNKEVAKQAVGYLLLNGHQKIALITGDQHIYTAKERTQGYKEAMIERNRLSEEFIYNGNLTVEGGYLAMKKIIEQHSGMSAVFATNYEMSVGAIMAINESGKKIPEDFSFIGFDNQELSKVFTPRLATVNQPLHEIGKTAAENMIALIEGGSPHTTVLSARFEKGESVNRMEMQKSE